MGGENGKLLDASRRGSEARAAKAIRKGAEVNWVDADGKAPLHYAAKSGYLHIVYLLLENKADANQRSEGNGDPPILKAVKNGHMDVCLALIQHKADVRIRPRAGDMMSGRKAAKDYPGIIQLVHQARQGNKPEPELPEGPPRPATATEAGARNLHQRVIQRGKPRESERESAQLRPTAVNAPRRVREPKLTRQQYEQRTSDNDFATAFEMARRAQDNAQMDREMDQELEEIMDTVNMLDGHLSAVTEQSETSPSALPGSPEVHRHERAHSEEPMLPTMGSIFTATTRSIPPPSYTLSLITTTTAASPGPHKEQEVAFHQVGWGGTSPSSEQVQTLEIDDSSDDEVGDDGLMEDK